MKVKQKRNQKKVRIKKTDKETTHTLLEFDSRLNKPNVNPNTINDYNNFYDKLKKKYCKENDTVYTNSERTEVICDKQQN